jgi:ABC-2 type transport system permease protein
MNKLWLIVEREYLSRVKKKSFILITLLSPLLFVAMFTLPALIALFSGKEQSNIAIKDDSGIFVNNIKSTDVVNFVFQQEPLDELKKSYKSKGFTGVLYIPDFKDLNASLSVHYFSEGQLSLGTQGFIENEVAKRIEAHKIKQSGYDEAVLKSFETRVSLEQKELVFDENGNLTESDKKSSAAIATAIGFFSGFIIYIILIFYGAMIMRSVMEEKTNRIVEVMISSVRPFQLMLGKILGASAVGLTQMVIWIALTIVLLMLAGLFLPLDQAASMQAPLSPMQQPPPDAAIAKVAETLDLVSQQNWSYIIPVFIFFFLGGYFIYASLFAAVGSAMGDDMGEGQSLSFVAMMPIILSILMMGPVIDSPNGPLAVGMSFIPLFSPVIMPVRIAFDPPFWQVLLSMVILAASAVFFVWLAGRIYRVGILLYGKKATLKEMGKWMFVKT